MSEQNWAAVRDAIAARLDQLDWSQAELARQSGVDADTIGALLSGTREPRPSTRRRLSRPLWGDEEAINKVLAGSPPAAVMLQDVHPPADDPPPVDYRSGAGTLDPDDITAARLAIEEERRTATATAAHTAGRLGLELVKDHDIRPVPDVLVRHNDDTATVIAVRKRPSPKNQANRTTELIGQQAQWRAGGVERVILFAYEEWPEDAIKRLAEFDIEYAGSQVELEQLLQGSDT